MSAGFTFRSIPRLRTLLSAPQGFLQELTQSRAKNGEAPKPVLIMLHVRQSSGGWSALNFANFPHNETGRPGKSGHMVAYSSCQLDGPNSGWEREDDASAKECASPQLKSVLSLTSRGYP